MQRKTTPRVDTFPNPDTATTAAATSAPAATTEETETIATQTDTTQAVVKPTHWRRRYKVLKAWVPAALIVGLAVWLYQEKENPQLQDVLSAVTNRTHFDDLIAKVHLAQLPAFNWTGLETGPRVGLRMAEKGLKAKHPVAIVPGFVTSGLELWKGRPCAKKYFRQRMWGTFAMLQTFLNDKECWFEHLSLDLATGLDPPGISLRAVEGFEAVDWFIQGYWVFNKIIEALADIGYTSSQLACMSYDWRMAASGTEVRDGYFSKLKATLEHLHAMEGERVVLVAHSMGFATVQNFFAWVEAVQPGWCEEHVHAFINIAGTTLGVPKAATAILSGELRESAHLGAFADFVAENVLSREVRARMWRSWTSLLQMLPAGGEAIWGNSTWAPDDDEAIRATGRSFGSFITALEAGTETMNNDDLDKNSSATQQADSFLENVRSWVDSHSPHTEVPSNLGETLTATEVLKLLVSAVNNTHYAHHAHNFAGQPSDVFPRPATCPSHPSLDPAELKKCVAEAESVATTSEGLADNECAVRRRQWFKNVDPLRQPLPLAPTMKLYCLYGVGIPTERGYHYLHWRPESEDSKHQLHAGSTEWRINKAVSHLPSGLDRGVQMSDGDGTVPLLSLGLMCQKGWHHPKVNPAGMKVVTREFKHMPEKTFDPLSRGGPQVADHVSILGNDDVIADVLTVAAGLDEEMDDVIVSNIQNIAAQVDFDRALA